MNINPPSKEEIANNDLWPYMHKVQDRYNELGFKLSFAMTCMLAMKERELDLAAGHLPAE